MKNLHLTLVPLGIVFLVAGCGGGGSSSSSSGGGSVPTANVKITTTNSNQYAKGAVSSTQQASNSASSGNSQLNIKSATQSGTVGVGTRNIANIVASEFNRVMGSSLTGSSVSKAAGTVSRAWSCIDFTTAATVGDPNSFAISVTTAGANFAVGDSFTLSYTSCDYLASGVVFAGSMKYTVNGYTAGSSASYTTTFNSFSVTAGTDSLGMSGDMTIAASLSGTKATSSISGSSFTVSLNADSFTMNQYSETYTLDSANAAYTYAISMSLVLNGTGGGTVDITTPTTFAGTGTGNPTAGKMKIAGTNGTYVTIAAYTPTQAEVVVVTETSTLTSHPLWSSL